MNLNISSETLNKGIDAARDAAKEFLGKLIMPSVEEVGLLIQDKVKMWRLNNQIKMLNKARTICEQNKINIRSISPKLIAPLLEGASLEEDENMQEKWAALLSNLIDSEQNIQNHVFPYMLSQLSSNEVSALDEFFSECGKQREAFSRQLKELLQKKDGRISEINEQKTNLLARINQHQVEIAQLSDDELIGLTTQKQKLDEELDRFVTDEVRFKKGIKAPMRIPSGELKQFEISNLVRLGLIKEVKEFYANAQPVEIPNHTTRGLAFLKPKTQLNITVDLESETQYFITELGEMFIQACKEKKRARYVGEQK